MTISIQALSALDLEGLLQPLCEMLDEAVRLGASLGFAAPMADGEARRYWQSLRPELDAGKRLLFVAFSEGRVVGSGQLALASSTNAPHRAEIQKLLVAHALRGSGVGKALMATLHDAARRLGRRLIVLGTRSGEPPEAFYHRLGYRRAGVIPGYTIGADGKSRDGAVLYRNLVD